MVIMVDTTHHTGHNDGMTTAQNAEPLHERLVPLLFRTAARLDDLGYDHRHRQTTGLALLLDWRPHPAPVRHNVEPLYDRLVPLLFRTAARLGDLGYDYRHRQAAGLALLLDGEHDENVAARLVDDLAEVQ